MKSHNNPYGVDQFPEWELWERAVATRHTAFAHENAAERSTTFAQRDHAVATAIEAALLKLRPPNGPPPKDGFGRLVVGGVPNQDFAYDDRS